MENENKGFDFGTENQQGNIDITQSFGAPQNDQSFGAPQNDQSFGAPQNDQSFGAPQSDQSFGAPQNDQSFGAPQSDQSFGADQSFGTDQSFGAPQNDQSFGGQQYGNQSFGTDQSFGGQQYGNQSFGTDQSFGGQTYGQPNQQFGYNSNMGYGMGVAPVDAKGNPLKNNFGMKMTFSILEILTCCGCNILTMIMGIIGCVFTTKANNAYKEGRWEEFKSQAKAATISLWIGFGLFVIGTIITIVLWTVGGLGDEFMEGYNEGYNSSSSSHSSSSNNNHDSSNNNNSSTADGDTLDGDVYVYVDGDCIEVPVDFDELKERGYYVSDSESDELIESDDYNLVSVMNASGEEVMWGWMYNFGSSSAYPEECTLVGVDVNCYCENIEDYYTSEGLGFDSTVDDFIDTYGYPDEQSGEEGDEFMCWYLGDGQDTVWKVMEVRFVDGELYDIDIDYID